MYLALLNNKIYGRVVSFNLCLSVFLKDFVVILSFDLYDRVLGPIKFSKLFTGGKFFLLAPFSKIGPTGR